VGVHTALKRWNQAGCSLMCALTGRKFWWMKSAVFWSSYDSASSRAQAPHAGAALKSSKMGRSSFLASASA
jgi:hypothetical protein